MAGLNPLSFSPPYVLFYIIRTVQETHWEKKINAHSLSWRLCPSPPSGLTTKLRAAWAALDSFTIHSQQWEGGEEGFKRKKQQGAGYGEAAAEQALSM